MKYAFSKEGGSMKLMITIFIVLIPVFVFSQEFNSCKEFYDPETNTWSTISYSTSFGDHQDIPFESSMNDIYHRNYINDSVFGANVQVDDGPENSNQGCPEMAIGGDGSINVVWFDGREGEDDFHIYFTRSLDKGATWTRPDKRVDNSSRRALFPSIASGGKDSVYVVWREVDLNVYFSRSIDGGQNWSQSVAVNGENTDYPNAQRAQFIAVDREATIYVAWADKRNSIFTDIYFSRSTDGGISWLEPNVRVNDDLGYDPPVDESCQEVGEDGTLYIVFNDWEGDVPGGRYPNVAFAKSTDRGNTWTTPNVIVNDSLHFYQFVAGRTMGIDENKHVYVGWIHDIWYQSSLRISVSMDGGESFNPRTRVDDDSSFSIGTDFSLTCDPGGIVYSVWTDDRNESEALFFAVSKDRGETWSVPNVRVDDDTSGSTLYSPVIATNSEGDIFVVWKDNRPGNWEYDIYFTKGTPLETAVSEERSGESCDMTFLLVSHRCGSGARSGQLPSPCGVCGTVVRSWSASFPHWTLS
jgi:hypothetical protein